MGKLLKGHLAHQWGIDPASIYHCAVMPCYDKKLEASREDFNLPGAYPASHSSFLNQACLHWPGTLQHCRHTQKKASASARASLHKQCMHWCRLRSFSCDSADGLGSCIVQAPSFLRWTLC